jgi:hypothetical protein
MTMIEEIEAAYERAEDLHGPITGWTIIWIHRDGVSASAWADATDPAAVSLAEEFIEEFNNPETLQ